MQQVPELRVQTHATLESLNNSHYNFSFASCLEPPPPGAGPRTSRPASPVDDDLLLSPPPPLFAEDWGARCSSPELWAHVGDLVEEPDVTYAGGFPEDYSDVFGAPAAALPAF